MLFNVDEVTTREFKQGKMKRDNLEIKLEWGEDRTP